MNSYTKKMFIKILLVVFLAISLFCFVRSLFKIDYIYAVAINKIDGVEDSDVKRVESLAKNFLQKNYNIDNLECLELCRVNTLILECDARIMGYYITFERDNEAFDYVIVENKTLSISEFGFNIQPLYEKVNEKSIEYFGNDYLYVKIGSSLYNVFNDKILQISDYLKLRKNYILHFAKKVSESAVSDGSGGMSGIPWYANERVYIAEQDYLNGINFDGVSSNHSFYNQNQYGINTPGNCGPTSMLNAFKYYQDLGYVSKKGLLPFDGDYINTYNNLANKCDYDWINGGSTQDSRKKAVAYYGTERGFSVISDMYYYYPSFNKLKIAIGKERICMLSIHVDERQSDGTVSDWGHAVLGVGYRLYVTREQRPNNKWEIIEQGHYVRTVDGWYSNSARYIDYDFYKVEFFEFQLLK